MNTAARIAKIELNVTEFRASCIYSDRGLVDPNPTSSQI